MKRPLLLDLFCGAGGAGFGYHQAGFEVIGVDRVFQKRYPFSFIQADALEFLQSARLGGFDLIHASPPCQAYTDLRSMWNRKQHPDLVQPVRSLLQALGIPYVIENVEGAPLENYIVLCGSHFGLQTDDGAVLRRHRLFETWPYPLLGPLCGHRRGERVIGVYGGHGRDRRRKVNTQDFSVADRRTAMGIGWMTGSELSQAIPPAYSRWIGERFLEGARLNE